MLEDVRELNLRKTNRMQAVLMKLDDIEETAKYYNIKPSVELIKSAKKMLSTNTSKGKMNTDNGTTISVLSLEVDNTAGEQFIEELQEKFIEAGEYIIEKELEKEKENLVSSYLKDAMDLMSIDAMSEYKKAIKSLGNLSKITKLNRLNKQAFEIVKDLRACLKYNDKIKKNQNCGVAV